MEQVRHGIGALVGDVEIQILGRIAGRVDEVGDRVVSGGGCAAHRDVVARAGADRGPLVSSCDTLVTDVPSVPRMSTEAMLTPLYSAPTRSVPWTDTPAPRRLAPDTPARNRLAPKRPAATRPATDNLEARRPGPTDPATDKPWSETPCDGQPLHGNALQRHALQRNALQRDPLTLRPRRRPPVRPAKPDEQSPASRVFITFLPSTEAQTRIPVVTSRNVAGTGSRLVLRDDAN